MASVKGMVPIAASMSSVSAARKALQNKWIGDGALGFLLSPSQLAWRVPEGSVRLAALPFWQFEVEPVAVSATVRTSPSASAQSRGGGDAGPSSSAEGFRSWRRRDMHGCIACPSMSVEEVYAGYDLPPSVASIVLDERIGRDEAQGARAAREESQRTAAAWRPESLEPIPEELQPAIAAPCMSEELAWSFVLRRIRTRCALEAIERAKATGADDEEVAAASCEVVVEKRRARLVAYPAYVFNYTFEKRYGKSGDVEDVPFTAVVAANNGVVSAVRHVCSSRSRIAGAFAGGLGAILFSLLSTPEVGGAIAAEVAVSASIASLSAGAAASRVPINAWSKIDSAREAVDRETLRGWEMVRESANGSLDGRSEALDWREEESFGRVWEDIEWRRWSQPDEWFGWDPEQRRKWAEELHHRHVQSQLQRYEKRIEDAMSARQAEADAAREQRKREKYGDEAFAGSASDYRGGSARSAKSDPHGYFRTLGLDRSKPVNVEEIKAAFRKEALKLHPDVKGTSSPTTASSPSVAKNDEAFQRLHHAYTECLRIKLAEDSRL